MTDSMPYAAAVAARRADLDRILAYGAAAAHEAASRAAVMAWRETYARCRPRMGHLHPCDADRLHEALRDAEANATAAHEAAMVALRRLPSPFSILAETLAAHVA